MIRYHKIVFVIIVSIYVSAFCADAYMAASGRLERIMSCLQIPEPPNDTIVDITYKNYPVIINKSNGEIVHVGIDIFGNDIKKKSNLLLCNFVEQYLLERLCDSSEKQREWHMSNDDVSLIGKLDAIPILTDSDSTDIAMNISFDKMSRYKVGWKNSSQAFAISFPPQYQLITGNNKIELENLFSRLANSHIKSDMLENTAYGDTISVSGNDSIYAVDNGFYVIKEMKNVRFITKSPPTETQNEVGKSTKNSISQGCFTLSDTSVINSQISLLSVKSITELTTPDSIKDATVDTNAEPEWTLVCDYEHPVESLYNLLSTTSIPNEFTVDVKVDKFGYEKEIFTCTLSQLIGFCLKEGCTPYVGIEKIEKAITAVLIMVQPNYKYNHSFKIVFDPEILKEMKGSLQARVNVYIPTHNIKTFFGEDAPNI